MKKAIIMAVLMGVCVSSYAHLPNAKSVPDDVLKAFASQYPNVTTERWKEVNDTFVVLFRMDDRRSFAYYTNDGQWVKTDEKLPWTKDLPCDVKYSFNDSQFGSWYVDRIARRESPTVQDQYVIQVHRDDGPDGAVPSDGQSTVRLYFSQDGSLAYEKVIR